MTRKKQKTYWAGYVDGKMDFSPIACWAHGRLYSRKKYAKEYYDDVRKVRIVQVRS